MKCVDAGILEHYFEAILNQCIYKNGQIFWVVSCNVSRSSLTYTSRD